MIYTNLISQRLQFISTIKLPQGDNKKEDHHQPPEYQLYSSASGIYIALVVNYGQFWLIFNTKTQKVIL